MGKFKNVFLVILVVLLVAGGGYYVLYFENRPSLATAYVAIGTLILAVATVALAGATHALVQQTARKDQHDRKDRILADIRHWAEEAAKTAISRQTRVPSELWETMLKYKYSLATSPYIKKVAEEFPSLGPLLTKTISGLEHAVEATAKAIHHEDESLIDREQQVRVAIEALLEQIASTKV